MHGLKDELWILYSTACRRGVPTKELQRKFMCSGKTIVEFQNHLIAQDGDRVKFWDIASDSQEPIFTTDEMYFVNPRKEEGEKVHDIFFITVIKAVRWLAVAANEGLFSLDLDLVIKKDPSI